MRRINTDLVNHRTSVFVKYFSLVSASSYPMTCSHFTNKLGKALKFDALHLNIEIVRYTEAYFSAEKSVFPAWLHDRPLPLVTVVIPWDISFYNFFSYLPLSGGPGHQVALWYLGWAAGQISYFLAVQVTAVQTVKMVTSILILGKKELCIHVTILGTSLNE